MRTYIPTLMKVLKYMCAYISKHRDVLLRVIGDENAPKLDGLITACNLIMPILEEFNPPGS
jgi:hypothetical protein